MTSDSGWQRTFFKKTPVHDLKALVACYGKDEFESPRRSTVPLLSMVRDGQDAFKQILERCGLTG